MSYIVLARRLRPKTLKEVIGQPLVIQALDNALKNNTLHPVYLLTGTRGVGKTTIARIIAKSLNCENGTSPCLKCDTCLMIQDGSYPDLYEIDAASRTKVEDTRDILEQVQYMPQMGKRKVYLIDEVHMLSQHSFNALLKTLEEPPAHVQFILATTEPEKIPKTILSRCLHFNLQPLTQESIFKYLSNTLTQDNIAYDEEALMQIAEAGDGSMRDALSLLDQCLAISPEKVDLSVTQPLLSTFPKAQLITLLKAIGTQDTHKIEAMCNEYEKNNIDFRQLLKQLSEQLIHTSIDQIRGQKNPLSDIWPDTYIQVLYRMLMQGIADLEHSPSIKLGSLMCLIRMAVFHPKSSTVEPHTANKAAHRPEKAQPKLVTLPSETPVTTTGDATESINWAKLTAALPLSPMLRKLAENCSLNQKSNTTWRLGLHTSQKHLLSNTACEKIQAAINQHLDLSIKLHIEIAKTTQNTPAMKQEAKKQSYDDSAREALKDDPVLNSLLSELNISTDDVEISSAER